ncbi:hypothetical protein LTR53_000258 [Teratosphaeriaceae sp. CCFEE 6253]|nr:hypothetical protein LTR53_000258 [Teratosphaeriaceae sp. CCFEE 6253]
MSGSEATTPMSERASLDPGGHEQQIETREAYEYWGYLFQPDKTGTSRLKSLLRGLKDAMNTQHNTDHNHGSATIDLQPDLTPDQLAHFYRDLHGNYDQLFLGTPHESLAFIYKSLGCLHSLQPQSFSHSTAFTDPTVPALKTEGWIMWQTIQLLLGPDEHSQFIMEAVQKWDIKDPVTGEQFPKLLPRACFPEEPDAHMVAWYEGVSERLRKEADDDERAREVEVEHAPARRLQTRRPAPSAAQAGELSPVHLTDDEGSVDSRGPALAYFRNPLYRHVDGRPSIIRRSSKRPTLSPRPTMLDKGKGAAATVGNVLRNVASPHLWEGRASSRHSSRDRDDMGRRRRSLPDHRHPSGSAHNPTEPLPPTSTGAYDGGVGLSPHEERHRRRRSLHQAPPVDVRPASADSSADEWDGDESSAYASPRPTPPHPSHRQRRGTGSQKRDSRDPTIRHSRSHEPTPSQKEFGDYFEGAVNDPDERRNSVYEPSSSAAGTPPVPAGPGGGFGPSASPLFASHIAKRPPAHAPAGHHPADRGQRMASADPYNTAPRQAPSIRRAQEQGRPYSRSPQPSDSDRRPDRRYESPRRSRSRFDQSPGGYDDMPPPPPQSAGGGRDDHHHRRPPGRPFDPPSHDHRRPPGGDGYGGMPPPGNSSTAGSRRRSTRMSGSELEDFAPPGPRREGRPKMTRFSGPEDEPGLPPPPQGPTRGGGGRPVSGVDGRSKDV